MGQSLKRALLISGLLLVVGCVAIAEAAGMLVQIRPGDSAQCPTAWTTSTGNVVNCTIWTPTPTPLPTRTPAPTPLAVAGQPCPATIHAQYVTAGPDGKQYPTWHPPIDPTTGCQFGHEHGADPRTSQANNTMPAFGYIGQLAGDNEPHEGFKIFVVNAHTATDLGPVPWDFRLVFHQGTSGIGRYTTRYHSMELDLVAKDGTGRVAHVKGMADTGDLSLVGSGCAPENGRNFSTLGCADNYEIWSDSKFLITGPWDCCPGDRLHVTAALTFSPAVFDPITTRNPMDASILYSQDVKPQGNQVGIDPKSPLSPYQGCAREIYMGPNFWNWDSQQTVYYTDPYGNVREGPGVGTIKQEISGARNQTGDFYKVRQDYCGNGIHAPN